MPIDWLPGVGSAQWRYFLVTGALGPEPRSTDQPGLSFNGQSEGKAARAWSVWHGSRALAARRLIGLAMSQGTVASLLKHGLSEDEIGISDLRQVAERILGGRMVSWFWSYRIRVGLK